MEFQKLNSKFQPEFPFDDFDSLIWTERYVTAGDFQLQSYDIERCLNMFPLESYVGVDTSTVPMIVESHKIIKPKNDSPKLEVRGRSFESVLERRASVLGALPNTGSRSVWTNDAVKTSDAAFHAIRGVIGDIARNIAGVSLGAQSPSVSALDAIPEILLVPPADLAMNGAPVWNSSTTYAAGTQVKVELSATDHRIYRSVQNHSNQYPPSNLSYWTPLGQLLKVEIKPGQLYATVIELLNANHHGIKAVRPLPGSAKQTVDIEIYNGADLTTKTIFDVKFDQFDDATYLLSYQGSTNIAYVYGGGPATDSGNGVVAGGTSVRKNTAGAEVSGLNRRVLLLDEKTDNTLNTAAIRTSRGLVELYKNNATAIFDGELARQIAEKYNTNVNTGGYSLGDIVLLKGEYGLERKVRVSEFIRTLDSKGETAYPAFEVVDE